MKCATLLTTILICLLYTNATAAPPTRTEEQAKARLERIFIKDAKITAAGAKYPEVPRILDEFMNCGLSSAGSLCLESEYDATKHRGVVWGTKEFWKFFQIVPQRQDAKTRFVIVTGIPTDPSKDGPIYLDLIWEAPSYHTPYVLRDYTEGKFPPLATFQVEPRPIEIAFDRLKSATNLRVYYHAAEMLLQTDFNLSRALVLHSLERKLDLISTEAPPNYTLALLELVRTKLPGNPEAARWVAERIFQLKDRPLPALAAITLAENGDGNLSVRHEVRQAFSSSDPHLRTLAVRALARVRKPEDDELIISRIGDPDPAVAKAAFDVSQQLPIGNESIFAIARLLESKSASVRVSATKLLGHISSDEATVQLLNSAKDPESEVRGAALEILIHRPLAEKNLPQIELLVRDRNPDIRFGGVRLAGLIPGVLADEVIFVGLNDSEHAVSSEAFAALLRRQLDVRDLVFLEPLTAHPNADTRIRAITLLGKIEQPEAVSVILRCIGDRDYRVRHDLIQALEHAQLVPAHVYELRKFMNYHEEESRVLVPEFLRRIAGSEATSTLIEMITDRSYRVRQSVAQAMEGREMDDSHVAQLGAILSIRVSNESAALAAYQLGESRRASALAILQREILNSHDYVVHHAIAAAIEKLQKQTLL